MVVVGSRRRPINALSIMVCENIQDGWNMDVLLRFFIINQPFVIPDTFGDLRFNLHTHANRRPSIKRSLAKPLYQSSAGWIVSVEELTPISPSMTTAFHLIMSLVNIGSSS